MSPVALDSHRDPRVNPEEQRMAVEPLGEIDISGLFK